MPRGEFDRSERRARTRSQLLDAAARVYARRGFDGATLDEVADEAGFTKGAVYDHFGSKEKLLLALLDEHLAAQIAEQMALFDPELDTHERPVIGADRWMEELSEDPRSFLLFVETWVHAQRDEELRQRIADGLAAWRAVFVGFARAREQATGRPLPGAELEEFAHVMIALAVGFGVLRLGDPERVSACSLGGAYRLLIGALESSPEAAALLHGAVASSGPRAAQGPKPSTPSSNRLRSRPPV